MPLMKDDRKGIAALIIRRIKGGDEASNMRESNERFVETPTKDGAEQDGSMGMMAAAEELIQAVESKDPHQVAASLRAAIEMVTMENPREEES